MVLVLLLSPSVAFASSSEEVRAHLSGGVVNAGDQTYSVQGGRLLAFVLDGIPYPSTLKLEYWMHAFVTGKSARGAFRFEVGSGDGASQTVSVEGKGVITGTLLSFDLGTSMVPLYFSGLATIEIEQVRGSGQKIEQVLSNVPMVFESPYLNPFGNPIVIASADAFLGSATPALVIVGTYTSGKIQWRNVVTGGQIQGFLGSSPYLGGFTQVASSDEDLVQGKEQDAGSITFSGITSIPFLNGNGRYDGSSVIPKPNLPSDDCSPPGLPGTCVSTGLNSAGGFELKGTGIIVSGHYQTVWPDPALVFSSTITGTGKTG